MRNVTKKVLSNGLTVLMDGKHPYPMGCVLSFFNIGSMDESDTALSTAHLLEHLLSKSSQVGKEIKQHGGHFQAGTSYDHTYYYSVAHPDHLLKTLGMHASLLRTPTFTGEDVEKEKHILYQELARKADQPHLVAWENLLNIAYKDHPLGRVRIGKEDDVYDIKHEDLMNFHGHHYAPNRCVLVVIGKFDEKELIAQVEKLFSKTSNVSDKTTWTLTESEKPRMQRMLGNLSHAIVKIGFHIPKMFHEDAAALHVLHVLLSKGSSSRFNQALNENRNLVEHIDSSIFYADSAGFLVFDADLAPENVSRFEEEFWNGIQDLQSSPPTETEMLKVRNIIRSSYCFEQDDVFNKAYKLGFYEAVGGFEKIEIEMEKLLSIQPADVMAVAKKYLVFDRMSIVEFVPERVGHGQEESLRLDSLRKRIQKNEKESAIPATISPTPFVMPTYAEGNQASPETKLKILPNGIRCLFLKTPHTASVNISCYFPGGRLYETENNCGITYLLLKMMLSGHLSDGSQLHVEDSGMQISLENHADFFGYSLNALTDHFPQALSQMFQLLTQPALNECELDNEKRHSLIEIRRIHNDLLRRSVELFYQSLYGRHPYGLSRFGTRGSLEAITFSQMVEWYEEMVQLNKLMIVVSGNVDEEKVFESISEQFGKLQPKTSPERAKVLPLVSNRGFTPKIEEKDRRRTGIVIGQKAVDIRDHRYYDLEVLRNWLAGMGGQLHTSLRDKLSMAYSVTAYNISLLRSGAFFIYAATLPENEKDMIGYLNL
ncbi:MAG: insulinase family protein, partial [Proteobacteria bacterium]|nr:insulinase family protein [Pseudomonadota bacterium]